MERRSRRSLAFGVALVVLLGPVSSAAASAGSADQSFGSGGVAQTHVSQLDVGLDVLVQPDGKAVTVGFAESDGILLRHRVDGTLDPGFGAGGVVRTSPPAFLQAGVLQPDGKMVVVGSNGALDDLVVFRYLATGAPDPGFGGGGFVQTDLGGVDQAYAVALQPDGRIVVAGRTNDALAVVRYRADGTLDPAFGTGGRTTTTFGPGSASEASSVGILSNGRIVVGGRTGPVATDDVSMLLARYTSGGALDTTFGSGGRVSQASSRMAVVDALVVQPGDRVVVAGTAGDDVAQVPRLARYLADGSLDTTFGNGGSTSAPRGDSSTADDLAVDPSGRLLTVGSTSYASAGSEPGPFSFVTVSRFSANGVIESAFGCAGSTQVELAAEVGGRGTGIAVAPDGRIVLGGIASTDATTDFGRPDFVLVRVLADGPGPAGYWVTRDDGGTSPLGTAGGCGSLRGLPLDRPVVDHAASPTGDGYWFVAADGGVFTRGDARFFGSAGGLPLARPVVGMAATPSGNGYWLVASDGGIFAYGDARFFGSAGGLPLARPVVGMAASPSGNGYWLVASDGGIFAYGDARFLGSTGGLVLDRPVIGMKATATGNGYWLAGADGGIFAYGDAPFLGSTGAQPYRAAAVALT